MKLFALLILFMSAMICAEETSPINFTVREIQTWYEDDSQRESTQEIIERFLSAYFIGYVHGVRLISSPSDSDSKDLVECIPSSSIYALLATTGDESDDSLLRYAQKSFLNHCGAIIVNIMDKD